MGRHPCAPREHHCNGRVASHPASTQHPRAGVRHPSERCSRRARYGARPGWHPDKMPVIPAFVVHAIFQLIEKCRKSINRGAIPAGCRIKRGRKHARRAGVGDHVVDLPAHALELCPRLLKVALVRQLLRPPAGIRNAVFLIHARGAAHGKDR